MMAGSQDAGRGRSKPAPLRLHGCRGADLPVRQAQGPEPAEGLRPLLLRPLVAVLGLCAAIAIVASAAAEPQGSFATGRYRNLFAEHLGKTGAEVDYAWFSDSSIRPLS